MAALINGAIVLSGGYEFGVKNPKSEDIYEFPTMTEAEKIANSIPGAKVFFRAVYVTEWQETLLC